MKTQDKNLKQKHLITKSENIADPQFTMHLKAKLHEFT